ncbi:MAG: heat-inducible transcription repressor HrcA [Ruminococcaceae bacterium]|nr:heat-inducible transcription repressor HrcA [Oscillospiraceae bacterium]
MDKIKQSGYIINRVSTLNTRVLTGAKNKNRGDSVADLTERKKRILAIIIERYIATGEPVGSKTICSEMGNAVSSATIRNEMADLVDFGLLEQPHTSAGRIPSQAGYRYYVDNLMSAYELGVEEQERIKIWLQSFAGEPDKLLEKANSILAELTDCVAVSSSPSDSEAFIKRIELVPLSSHTAMIVLLATSGILKSTVVRSEAEINVDIAEVFYNITQNYFIDKNVSNISVTFIQTLVASLGERVFIMSPFLCAIADLCKAVKTTDIHLKGQSNILNHSEFSDDAFSIMDFLYRETPIENMLNAQKKPLNVSIGTENIYKELKNSSTIFSKYSVGDRDSGSIGIIGPTRIDYARLIPSISYLAGVIGTLLSETLDE